MPTQEERDLFDAQIVTYPSYTRNVEIVIDSDYKNITRTEGAFNLLDVKTDNAIATIQKALKADKIAMETGAIVINCYFEAGDPGRSTQDTQFSWTFVKPEVQALLDASGRDYATLISEIEGGVNGNLKAAGGGPNAVKVRVHTKM